MRGSVVKRGRKWSYVVDVGRDPESGRRRQQWKGGFPTKRAEAELALRRALDAVDAGEVANAGVLTVAAYLGQWLTGVQNTVKPTTAKSYAEVLRWYVIPRVSAVRLSDLTPLHIRSLYADLLAHGGRQGHGVSAGTVRGCASSPAKGVERRGALASPRAQPAARCSATDTHNS